MDTAMNSKKMKTVRELVEVEEFTQKATCQDMILMVHNAKSQ